MATLKVIPSILPGFMELLPKEQLVFNSMVKTIQESYELFGFVPLDTPIIEKAEVLMAKGGDEAEKQTYRFKKGDNDLALRFDLTVPLARYVSEHFNDLNFPFRRYQIGKVYRGEKPQKGRFREFYQCDIDIIGNGTLDLVNDAEILAVIFFTFNRLEIGKFQIRLNNRKLLTGFMQDLGLTDKTAEILRLIDKLEKIGKGQLTAELKNIDVKEFQINKLFAFLTVTGDSATTLSKLKDLEITNETFVKGLEDLEEVVKYIKYLDIPETNWKIDPTIARGLDYYTGTVYETNLTDYPELGSICSGGRYDDLAQYYTDKKLPGVGISIGLTRLFYQLNNMNLLKTIAITPTKFLLLPLTEELKLPFSIATKMRVSLIPTEVYTGKESGIRKKLEYANKIGVPYVGILGTDEIKKGTIVVKDMKTGVQNTVTQEALGGFLKSKLWGGE